MDALDLDVEQGIGRQRHLVPPRDEAGEVLLVRLLDRGEAGAKSGVAGARRQLLEPIQVDDPATVAQGLADQLGQFRVGIVDPAARRYAVGDRRDPVGEQSVKLAKHGLLHQLAVQGRDPVDLAGTQKSEIAHAHEPTVALVDQRDVAQERILDVRPAAQVGQDIGVDLVDQLHLPRQQPLHQVTDQRSSASGISVWLV